MYYIGIDVAKSFHIVTVINENEEKVISKPFRVENLNEGFAKAFDYYKLYLFR